MIDKKKLISELDKMPRGGIVFVETRASKIWEVNLTVVKWLSEKNYTQIITSASMPCKKLYQLYGENNIDIRKLIALCAYPEEKEKDKLKHDNIIHINDNHSLVNIAISLSDILKTIEDKKFIFIDSINTLLIHNKQNTLTRFIHLILTKMRINNVSGILISLETETNKGVRAEIAQLCDKVIKI